MPLGSKLTPPWGVTILHWIIKGNLQTIPFFEPLMGIWLNSTGVPGWSPTKIVQMVLIGCISRSQGKKRFSASSRGPLPKLFKLCPWGQNWTRPGGHNFTLNYIRKTSNDFFSWATNGNLTKLNRNGHWVVPYQICSNGSDWLHK